MFPIAALFALGGGMAGGSVISNRIGRSTASRKTASRKAAARFWLCPAAGLTQSDL